MSLGWVVLNGMNVTFSFDELLNATSEESFIEEKFLPESLKPAYGLIRKGSGLLGAGKNAKDLVGLLIKRDPIDFLKAINSIKPLIPKNPKKDDAK